MPASGPIVCLGAAHWDVLGRAAVPLAPGADVPGRVSVRPGGVAFNVASALAARGMKTMLVAAVGRDAEGDRLAGAIAAAGIGTDHLLRHSGATDSYLAIEGPDGALHAAVADCAGIEATGAALLGPLAEALHGAAGLVIDGNLPEAVVASLACSRTGLTHVALVSASPEKAARLRPALALAQATLYANVAEASVTPRHRLSDRRGLRPGAGASGARSRPRHRRGAGRGVDARRFGRSSQAAARRAPQRHRRRRHSGRRPPPRPRRGRHDAAALETALAAAATHISRELP